MTKVTDFKKEEVEIPSEFIHLFSIEEKVLKGLSPKGIERLTVFLDVRGVENLNVANSEELKVLLKFRKKSDRTPKEQKAYEILVKERLKKKMISQLVSMQAMWIKTHRIPEKEISSYNDNELRRQYQMHDTLWGDYILKPTMPKLCETCGIEVGRCEVLMTVDGKSFQYNDKCRECYEK